MVFSKIFELINSILMFIFFIMILLYFINSYLRYKRHQAATPWSVKEKVVVITGAASGIGEQYAYDFANKGAILILCDYRYEDLKLVSKNCKGATGVSIYKTDVSNESDVKRLIETIDSTYNKIDCLVLNAGVSMGESLEEIDDFNLIREIMNINYIGSTMFTYYSLPLLKKSKKSRIIIMSSLIAIIPTVPLRTGYIASKCAVTGFFESLQAELIDYDIFITIAYPGIVATGLNEHRLGKNPKHADFSYAMSAKECAQTIIEGAIKGHKEVILTNTGKIGKLMGSIFPDILFYLSYNRSKKFIGRNEK